MDSAAVHPQPNPMGSSGTRDKDGLTELSHLEAKRLGFYTLEFVVGYKHPWTPPRHFWVEERLWTKSKSLGTDQAASCNSQQQSHKRAGLGKDLASTMKAPTIPLKQKMMKGLNPRKDYVNLYLKPISSYFINKSIWTSCSLLNR